MLVLSGIVLGLSLGYSLERSGFCMNTAFRSILFDKDKSILRAYVLALMISSVGVVLLEFTRWIYPLRSPFSLPALVTGGFLFGLGMVSAGGCVSGTYYRSGRGMLGSAAALIAFALSASLFSIGPLEFVNRYLNGFQWTVLGEEPALYHLFSLKGSIGPFGARFIWLGLLILGGIFFMSKAPREEFVIGWGWKLSGLVIGLLSVAAWGISGYFLRDYGLSFTQPTVSWTQYLVSNETGGLSWASYMVLGVLGGSWLSAVLSGEFGWRVPKADRLAHQFAGGLLMGTGASIGGGCNIGHGLTGISAQSLASVTATACTILGVWTGTALLYRKQQIGEVV